MLIIIYFFILFTNQKIPNQILNTNSQLQIETLKEFWTFLINIIGVYIHHYYNLFFFAFRASVIGDSYF